MTKGPRLIAIRGGHDTTSAPTTLICASEPKPFVALPHRLIDSARTEIRCKCNDMDLKCNSSCVTFRSVATDVSPVVDQLREIGGDTATIEVKAAIGGLSPSLRSTLSAFGNLPGGGTVILGLDEHLGFVPVGLAEVNKLRQGLAAMARDCRPPVQVSFVDDAVVDGKPVLFATVAEVDPSAKPCRAGDGKAYLRSYDGDYELSQVEEQAFLAQRRQPRYDRQPVDGASDADLDPELVNAWAATVVERDPTGLGRFGPSEMLRRGGVVTPDGTPTVAGLLALGVQPQQWFPRYTVQVAAAPAGHDQPRARARNTAAITGPIPRMLDGVLRWARETMDQVVVSDQETGVVRDSYTYPSEAIRELVSNALIHRDLDQWSQSHAVELRLLGDRLVISNPGGLYGITVDRLGAEAVTSARNAQLLAICQHTRLPGTDARVVEALATGIPTINRSLAEAGLPAAQYADGGIRFTVVLRRGAPPKPPKLRANELAVYEALADRPKTAKELATTTGLTEPTTRKQLRALRDKNLVTQHGGRGKTTTYERTGD